MILSKYFILFFIYSFLGWCIEVIDTLIETKKLVNRGFMVGPYCPIHGTGAILSILLFRNFTNPAAVFILGALLATVLEYITSYFMEKIFHARWWDYSDCKYNINGRVKLLNSILFGFAIVFVVCGVNPILEPLIFGLSNKIITIISTLIFSIMLVDFVISFNIIKSIKKLSKGKKDNTYEISKIVLKKLSSKDFLLKRLLFAFPNLIKKGIFK